jgi:quinoprotein glucose dehydrogenase
MRSLGPVALLCLLLAQAAACREAEPPPTGGGVADWPHYGNDPGGSRYSPLAQIGPANVRSLEIAWTFRTGDFSDGRRYRRKTAFEATPIVVDGTLYVSTPFDQVIALDPETGALRWRFDPGIDRNALYSEPTSRGVSQWLDPARAPGEPCRRSVFIGTLDARLFALDAATGRPCAGFGNAGSVDLAGDVGAIRWPGEYQVSSPPVALDGIVVVGSAISDNSRVEAPRGSVRAFDARTGALRWTFDPVPRSPADPAHAGWTAEGALRTGAANAWSVFSVDEARGLVFVPTGSASPDFFGGVRKGSNVYANSVVALRAKTGEVAWHFQAVHHDLWDYDVPAQPLLVDLPVGGERVPVVVQVTKMGHVFVLHRDTGAPVYPVEERPVPASRVPGEEAWPTQPFPTRPPPLHPTQLSPDAEAFGLTPWDRGICRDRLAELRHEGMFTPPDLDWTLAYPSNAGGSNWGSAAFDPVRNLLVLNQTLVPFAVKLIPRERFEAEKQAARESGDELTEFAAQEGTPYGMARRPVLGPLGVPCNRPPWGTLLAVDLATGEKRFEVPLGTVRDLAPLPIPIRWGTPNLGGPLLTASGLVFIGAAMDDYLRAFDVGSGEELWKGRLPAGGQATPMTYRLREDGRQFVVIAAGGHGKLGTTLGDTVVAFALP